MKQKIGIIQALMARPPVAILDEPTAGLDPMMVQAFRETVAELKRAGRTTVFLSSHVLAEVESTCDRIGLVRGGRIVTTGTIEHLKRDATRRVTISFDAPVQPPAGRAGRHRGARDPDEWVLDVRGPLGPLIARAGGPAGARPRGRAVQARGLHRAVLRRRARDDRAARCDPPARRATSCWRRVCCCSAASRSSSSARRRRSSARIRSAAWPNLLPEFLQRGLGSKAMLLATFKGTVAFGYFHPVVCMLVVGRWRCTSRPRWRTKSRPGSSISSWRGRCRVTGC